MANKLHQIVAFALLCSGAGFLPPRESAAQNTFEPTAGQPGKESCGYPRRASSLRRCWTWPK